MGSLFALCTNATPLQAAPQGAGAPKTGAAAPPVGGVGESCRAKADCAAGLSCLSNVCRDQMEGASCTARADCGTGQLKCVESKCVSSTTPATPPADTSGTTQPKTSEPKSDFFSGGSSSKPEPSAGSGGSSGSGGSAGSSGTFGSLDEEEDEPRRERSSGRSSNRTEGFEGIQPHVGMALGGGPTVAVSGRGSGTVGGFLFALKGGVLIDRIELGLEFSPVTFLPAAELPDYPVLQMNAYAGYHIPVYENFSWPLRGGLGFSAVNSPAALELRFDLIGISALFGPVLLDLYLPSFRVFTDFDSGTVMHFMFGVGGSILPLKF